MKAFEFKPKLYTALKNYSKELFYGRPDGRYHCRYRSPATCHCVWYCIGCIT